jgi:hypothetical protein
MVELEASFHAVGRELSGCVDQQFFLLSRREVHAPSIVI